MYLGHDRSLGCGRGGQRDRRFPAVSPPYTYHVSPVWSGAVASARARSALRRSVPPPNGVTTGRERGPRPSRCYSLFTAPRATNRHAVRSS